MDIPLLFVGISCIADIYLYVFNEDRMLGRRSFRLHLELFAVITTTAAFLLLLLRRMGVIDLLTIALVLAAVSVVVRFFLSEKVSDADVEADGE